MEFGQILKMIQPRLGWHLHHGKQLVFFLLIQTNDMVTIQQ